MKVLVHVIDYVIRPQRGDQAGVSFAARAGHFGTHGSCDLYRGASKAAGCSQDQNPFTRAQFGDVLQEIE